MAELERVTGVARGLLATDEARSAVRALRDRLGPVMFVQSAGCCAGSVPMCFADGEFLVGDRDLLLGSVEAAPFYIDGALARALRIASLVLDVRPGEPEGFSLGAGPGCHFVTTVPSAAVAATRPGGA